MSNARSRTFGGTLRNDDGVSAVLVSLLMVFVIIPVAAVSVDLSNAFSNRRQMQNAADAAAQAGAQQLDAVRQGTADSSTLDAVVKKVAEANDADTSSPDYSCHVARVTYDPVNVIEGPSCATWAGETTYNAVTVHTQRNVGTFFARAIFDAGGGLTSTSATAEATATVQKATEENLGNAVFAMCAFGKVDNHGQTDPSFVSLLVSDAAGNPVLNDAAIGSRYVVWSNAGGNSNLSRCGLGSASFDGHICGLATPNCGQPISLPNWLAITTGAQVGPTLALMAGYPSCQPDQMSGTHPGFTPCAMELPVCNDSNNATGTNGQLHCVAFGEFLLSPGNQDNNDLSCTFVTGNSATICGEFLGPPVVPTGTPSCDLAVDPSCTPSADDTRRIALVQ